MNLLLSLLEAIGLVTPAAERHVADTGDDADDGSAATPYRTIAKAMSDAAALPAGRRMVVKVSGKHTESLTLRADVTIEGPAELQAASPGPAVRILGTAATRLTGVELRDLKIRGARPYSGHGGAVLVERAGNLTMERCELHDSDAGRGGGLAVLDSLNVKLRSCQVRGNTAATPTTLDGADIVPSLTLPSGDGHGGGIYLRDSDVEITACDVAENQAILFGGGIAVSNSVRPEAKVEIVDCEVIANQVSHPPLTPLGVTLTGRRADMGDPVHEAFSDVALSEENERKVVSLLHGMNFESGLGGGIAVRSATGTRIARCHIGVTRAGKEGGNRARRGGGIACYTGGYPTIEDNQIAHNAAGGDGGGITIDLFDPFLPTGISELFGVTAVPMVPRDPIEVLRNHIHHNAVMEDGGGLYATGAARVVMRGGVVEENRSAEDGGGVRVTYAADLLMDGVAVRHNQSNVVGTEKDGGGGVASRNASMHLRDCELTGNTANAFAGGAVYFVSCWEGGIEGTVIPSRRVNAHGTFDQVMEDPAAFGFRTRQLRIENCRGRGNKALGISGAGGFLYAVRSSAGDDGGGESMWVVVEGPRTEIGLNHSEHENEGMRKRGNVVVELSGRMVGSTLVPQDRVWIGDDIPAGEIEKSTPALPAVRSRALVVIPGANPAGDIEVAEWTGAGFVHGPAPAVTGVTPAVARTAGGTVLDITGARFEAGLEVLVGGVAATVGSRTATTISATTPPGPAGTADLTVVSPSGARATLADAITLLAPPAIAELVPDSAEQGDDVLLRGTSIAPGARVHLLSGGAAAEATVTGTPTGTELHFTVPASPGPAPIDVRVTSPTGETVVRAAAFTYLP
jgi:hypothetical protein